MTPQQRRLMHQVPGDGLFGRLSRMGALPLVLLLLLLLGVAGLLQLADNESAAREAAGITAAGQTQAELSGGMLPWKVT